VREALVYAVAVAVSPVPIGATLLLLTCPRREANGLSFLAGWVVGVGTLAVLFVVLVEASGSPMQIRSGSRSRRSCWASCSSSRQGCS